MSARTSAASAPSAPREDGPRLRSELIRAARASVEHGLNVNKSGNVSARCVRGSTEGVLITPTAIAYEDLAEADLVFIELESSRQAGVRAASSEWRFHADILRARPEFAAIVHTHSPAATALACHGSGLPAFHYMVAVCGGPDVRCAPYATFGTQALSDHALVALQGRKACLLANHGSIGCGTDLAEALAVALEVEHLARIYLLARQLGEPLRLSEDEMLQVREKFRTSYGQR